MAQSTARPSYTVDDLVLISVDDHIIEPPGLFDAHIPAMEGFHQRYMSGQKVMQAWARMVRELDIETIAPQHGALFKGKEMSNRFIDWVEGLECGIDLIAPTYRIPGR